MSKEGHKTRTVNLRRNRLTTVSGLQSGDTVTPVWDADKWEWRLLIKSRNGVVIRHVRLTSETPKA